VARPSRGPLRIALAASLPAEAAQGLRAGNFTIVEAKDRPDFLLVAVAPDASPPPALPPARPALPEAPRLKRREAEILGYLADGWSNAEIASVLHIGVRTVRFHLESLYGKLRVSRRGEAVSEGYRLGLLRFEA
jgi:DNA-binding CsgD family transcriptional regulator